MLLSKLMFALMWLCGCVAVWLCGLWVMKKNGPKPVLFDNTVNYRK